MMIVMVGAWEATVVHCIVKNEKHGGHCQKVYTDIYGIIVRTATMQLIGNIRKFVKHRPWESFTVEKDEPGSGGKREAVMRMSRMVTNIWKLPLVRETFTSMD